MTAALVGRAAELAALEAAVDAACGGAGRLVVVHGEPGIGKTTLLRAAAASARGRGRAVLAATAEELEQPLPWVVARALLGAAAPVAMEVDHVARAIAGAAGEAGLVVVVDDLQWCDEPTLQALHYLARRLDELPILLLVARREVADGGPGELLRSLDALAAQRLAPAPLDGAATLELGTALLGDGVSAEVAERCRALTSGNPFYLGELFRALADGSLDVRELGASPTVPAGASRAALVRVGRLGADAVAVARAAAVLEDGSDLALTARLAGLELDVAADAAAALAGAAILEDRATVAFAHPLVREAVLADTPAAHRAVAHLRAAELLHDAGAPATVVAGHLVLAPSGGAWAAEVLCEAAAQARADGAPAQAVRYLDHALPDLSAAMRSAILAARAHDAVAALHPDAPALVAEAIARQPAELPDAERAQLERALGRACYVQGRHAEAADAYARARALAGDDAALAVALRIDEVSAALLVPGAGERVDELLAPAAERGGAPGLRAQAALVDALRGRPCAGVVAAALEAWGDGALLDAEGAGGLGWVHVSGALHSADDHEACIAVCERVLLAAGRDGDAATMATAWYTRGIARWFQGRVREAADDTELALAARHGGWEMFAAATVRARALCAIETGDLARADELITGVLATDDGSLQAAGVLWALGRLRLVQGRAEEAAAAFAACGAGYRRFGFEPASAAPWDAGLALAAAARGDAAAAAEHAAEALAVADRAGTLNLRLAGLRARAAAEAPDAAVVTLTQAVAAGDAGPRRLEHVHALAELGTALRRAKRVAESRDPLRRALDLAARGGMTALEERVRTELQVVGARPRRTALGGRDALTPSELRVAELVAGGMTNRQAAAALFVTPKTVEYHLAATYRKLGVRRRDELTAALS